MKRVLLVIAIAMAFAWTSMAQDQTGTSSSQTTTTTTTTKKSHKKAASSDTGASDTASSSKSSGKKRTVTGCVSKDKDANGNYTLSNGRYKNGVDVTGSDDLSAHAGHKVQLTGTWTTPGKTFEETKVKHISETCTVGGASSASSGSETSTTTTTTKKSKKTKTGTDSSSATPKS
ncbi:MAG: hypothetical protein ACXVZV_14975 [Terriglobales bacterium]